MISDVLDSLLLDDENKTKVLDKVKTDVINICKKYPIYSKAY